MHFFTTTAHFIGFKAISKMKLFGKTNNEIKDKIHTHITMLRQNANDCSLFDSAKLLKVTEMQQDMLNPGFEQRSVN